MLNPRPCDWEDLQLNLGWMLVGIINEHADWRGQEDDDVLGTAGCVINCGPCGALKWFSDNARVEAEELIWRTGFTEGGWSYWDSDAGRLRWDVLEAYWARHKGCASVDGVSLGCDFDHAEDDEQVEDLLKAFEGKGVTAEPAGIDDVGVVLQLTEMIVKLQEDTKVLADMRRTVLRRLNRKFSYEKLAPMVKMSAGRVGVLIREGRKEDAGA